MTTAVVLTGRPGGTTARAVEVLAGLPPELRLIGGLAVLCRVGVPHRATVDLDALARGLDRYDDAVRSVAVSSTGGGQYVMAGRMELDVIDVRPVSAAALVDQLVAHGDPTLTDLELNAVAHTWAHDTATAMDVSVVSDETHEPLARARRRLVASPAGLVAGKGRSVPLRARSRPEEGGGGPDELGGGGRPRRAPPGGRGAARRLVRVAAGPGPDLPGRAPLRRGRPRPGRGRRHRRRVRAHRLRTPPDTAFGNVDQFGRVSRSEPFRVGADRHAELP